MNEIFESFRTQKKKERKAVNLLLNNGYTVLDTNGNVLTKKHLDDESSR